MTKRKPKRVREQVVVCLDARDHALLEELSEKTGLSRTELLRRGLRRLADETLGDAGRGSSLRYLVATATADGFPPDVAERADHYLYGGGYQQETERARKKRARSG